MTKQTTAQMKAQHGYDVKQDGRYSVRLEWSGAPTRQWIARFCGEWLGSFADDVEAYEFCDDHHTNMLSPAL